MKKYALTVQTALVPLTEPHRRASGVLEAALLVKSEVMNCGGVTGWQQLAS